MSRQRPSSTKFESEARQAIAGLRSALAELIAGVQADPTAPQEMSRRFGLDRTLTWKISKVIGNDDALAAVVHVPGRPSIRALVDAFTRGGASADSAASVLAAMDLFEDVVKRHSGDRDTFEVMLGFGSDPLSRKHAESLRKSLSQAASAVWGVRARVQLSVHFVAPNAVEPDRLDLAVMAGLLDFRRLRPDVTWTIATMASRSDDGTPMPNRSVRPMDGALRPGDPPLLERFCSTPVPELRKTVRGNGVVRYELAEGPIGITAGASCVAGWVAMGEVGRYRTPEDRFGGHIVRLNTPVEVLYHDLFVHRDLAFALEPAIRVYLDLPGGPTNPFDGSDRGQLPIADEVIDLGEGPPSVGAADVPRYKDMVTTGVHALGRDLEEFHAFRFRVKYPPIPAQALYRYELPERA